jgi:4-hydroxybenzoyl-CoA reductase subunit beta
MLRLPAFGLEKPTSLAEALALLSEHREQALPIAGGTDLLPNLKHGLFEPRLLVSLAGIPELHRLEVEADGSLVIGAMVSLERLAGDERVARIAPALSQAVGLISGPQLRQMGTLGGNVMLDTRCQWYNQTYFWRKALGFCLKKDGTVCHVVESGQRCVAAASNDSAPALLTLDARLCIAGAAGEREVPIEEFFTSDGIHNKRIAPDEILCELRVPATPSGHRGAYGKLRDRGSIDFPLLGVAARMDLGADGRVERADLALVALQARPLRVRRAGELLIGLQPGSPDFGAAVRSLAELAHRQCHPLANVPGDHDYRQAMVPVYVRHTLEAAAAGGGPVHAL